MAITQQKIQDAKRRYDIIGSSDELDRAILRSLQAAPFNISVLVSGESGTGKETIPKIIHENGPRSHKPYFAVNCGSIPQGLIESTLFGHVKGAFTDAITDHKGYFENADGGTIFLDELGEMPLETQAKLLRVLETGEFIKVGADKIQHTNVRIIAATNKDLLKAIEEGKFREDLYYRISSFEITMPPLRDRSKNDFALLARFFARKFADANHMRAVRFTPKAIDLLASLEWKGNVRQYKNIIDRISMMESETERELTDIDIKQYLPHDRSNFLPVKPDHGKSDYAMERTALWAAINALGEEIKQMKQLVTSGEHYVNSFVNPNAQDLQRNVTVDYHNTTVLEHMDMKLSENVSERPKAKQSYRDVAMDVSTVKTLDETEREAIHDALRRNEGNRKRTADELKISERTLYRKIKQFNLVNNDK